MWMYFCMHDHGVKIKMEKSNLKPKKEEKVWFLCVAMLKSWSPWAELEFEWRENSEGMEKRESNLNWKQKHNTFPFLLFLGFALFPVFFLYFWILEPTHFRHTYIHTMWNHKVFYKERKSLKWNDLLHFLNNRFLMGTYF